jgi:hypothetical protein
MTQEPETPEDVPQAADLAGSERAESADGLPLPPPDDDEPRLASDTEESADEEEDEEPDVAEQMAAARGAE